MVGSTPASSGFWILGFLHALDHLQARLASGFAVSIATGSSGIVCTCSLPIVAVSSGSSPIVAAGADLLGPFLELSCGGEPHRASARTARRTNERGMIGRATL